MSCKNGGANAGLLMGGALIAIGALLLLNQMGLISHWFNFWAMVFLIGGVVNLLNSPSTEGILWGIFLISIGAVLELDQLGYLRIRLSAIWPVFVIAAGVILIYRAYQPEGGPATNQTPHLNVLSILGGGEYRIRTKNLRGGTLVAFMGGFEVDLREADIEGNEAVITINALMGGGVLRVPETWAVSMQVGSFMGGHSLKTREGAQTNKTLVVKGLAIMGGVEVKN